MNTPPKIMVDTGIVSIGWADPACWEFVDDTICPLSNKLKIYRIRSRKASVEELIAVQAIGRAARNKEIALYEYSELRWIWDAPGSEKSLRGEAIPTFRAQNYKKFIKLPTK